MEAEEFLRNNDTHRVGYAESKLRSHSAVSSKWKHQIWKPWNCNR